MILHRSIPVLALLVARAAASQVVPVGDSILVEEVANGYVGTPSVAGDGEGGFMVIWFRRDWGSPDSSVRARRFGAGGEPTADAFRVMGPGDESSPVGWRIGSLASGRFIVVWYRWHWEVSYENGVDVHAQLFDFAGQPIGDELKINTLPSRCFSDYDFCFLPPAVATSAAGDFVVAWTSSDWAGPPSSSRNIQARLLDADGAHLDDQFQVNTLDDGDQEHATVAVTPDGDFLVLWASNSQADLDPASGVRGQWFGRSGVAKGDEFGDNTYDASYQAFPAVGSDALGNLVVAWESDGSYGSDTSWSSVQAQRMNSSGEPIGDEFQVNTLTEGRQGLPAVAVAPDGSFLIAWVSLNSSTWSLRSQYFTSEGAPLGAEYLVGVISPGDVQIPAVAATGKGSFVIAWPRFDSGPPYWSTEILAQRFVVALFADGFESGDSDRWSETLP